MVEGKVCFTQPISRPLLSLHDPYLWSCIRYLSLNLPSSLCPLGCLYVPPLSVLSLACVSIFILLFWTILLVPTFAMSVLPLLPLFLLFPSLSYLCCLCVCLVCGDNLQELHLVDWREVVHPNELLWPDACLERYIMKLVSVFLVVLVLFGHIFLGLG